MRESAGLQSGSTRWMQDPVGRIVLILLRRVLAVGRAIRDSQSKTPTWHAQVGVLW